MRSELHQDSGSLRREMNKTLSDMQTRYSEQQGELNAREARLQQLRCGGVGGGCMHMHAHSYSKRWE